MKIAFYLAKFGNLWSKAIALYTRGPYSHCELVFDDAMREFLPGGMVFEHDAGGSLCYTSTSAAPRKGCGFENINLSDGKWILLDLPVTFAQQFAMLQEAIHDNGKGYDWRGDMGFVFPPVPDDRDDRFCSEECTLLPQRNAGYFPGVVPVRTSPNELYDLMTTKK